MAARVSMLEIVAHVRLLISDPAGFDAQFSDEAIQGALDDNRLDVDAVELSARLSDKQFVSEYGWWETGTVLTDEDDAVLVPTFSDLRRGAWTFTLAQELPVYLTGSTYDVYGAAADLLEMWAGSMASDIESFTADGLTVKRSGRANMAVMASSYRAKARGFSGAGAQSARFVRTDTNTW